MKNFSFSQPFRDFIPYFKISTYIFAYSSKIVHTNFAAHIFTMWHFNRYFPEFCSACRIYTGIVMATTTSTSRGNQGQNQEELDYITFLYTTAVKLTFTHAAIKASRKIYDRKRKFLDQEQNRRNNNNEKSNKIFSTRMSVQKSYHCEREQARQKRENCAKSRKNSTVALFMLA